MKTSSIQITVSESIGNISAECYEPESMKAVFVLAHGAGAGMNHPFMTSLAEELALKKIGTVRFNFPFIQQKKKRPDVPAVAHKTIEVVIDQAKKLFPLAPIFAGGKSFGGRMTTQFLAKNNLTSVRGIILIGFPLHPAGNPSVDRAEHLKNVNLPMLFLQGTRDTLAEWELIKQVTDSLPQATLVEFKGADHSFKVAKQNLIPDLAQSISKWITPLIIM